MMIMIIMILMMTSKAEFDHNHDNSDDDKADYDNADSDDDVPNRCPSRVGSARRPSMFPDINLSSSIGSAQVLKIQILVIATWRMMAIFYYF